ncbi:MAG: hypothetical protein NZO58_06740, partial [Gemmataceae bacterium]|nr:hypothetical protein [Gemmataceae bacterium]
RFPLPELSTRRHAVVRSLATLDRDSSVALLRSLGVKGSEADLAAAAQACGWHAKAVELLGVWLARWHDGAAGAYRLLPLPPRDADAADEERLVAGVLAALRTALSAEANDIVALATAFRQPPGEAALLDFLASAPVRHLLHDVKRRSYPAFSDRPPGWLKQQLDELVQLRLLERVGRTTDPAEGETQVIDAHPLVRRGFEDSLGPDPMAARAKAGFLRGRPDRRPPATLADARDEVELFHAYCDARLWTEADDTFAALDNPKHRLLAPAFERDLLLRFFPEGDWRRPPLWSGFGRWRSLAICHEMLGLFEEALALYRPADAPLRGDALLALGRLQPLLDQPHVGPPWQSLWQAYRAHALARAGRRDEALALVRRTVPVDIYEWVHVFECLWLLGRLDLLDVRSLLWQAPHTEDHRFARLARRRLRADWLSWVGPHTAADRRLDLDVEYRDLIEQYDLAGLPWERARCRVGFSRWLRTQGRHEEAAVLARAAADLCRRHGMAAVEPPA